MVSERNQKIRVMADYLKLVCHEDGPFKAQFAGAHWNYEQFAEHLLKLTEQVEIDNEERWFARMEANHDEKSPF